VFFRRSGLREGSECEQKRGLCGYWIEPGRIADPEWTGPPLACSAYNHDQSYRGLPVAGRRPPRGSSESSVFEKPIPTEMTLRSFRYGPFVRVRPIRGVHGCDRMIMLHEQSRTNHLLYRFEPIQDAVARRRVFDRLMRIARLDHPHILPVEHVGYDDTGRLCVVTEYPGNQDGLVTLQDLVETRGGTLEFSESTRLITQLLETSCHARERGIVHGEFGMNELLVDRHGCTLVELYGLAHAMRPSHDEGAELAEQARSVARIGLRLTTGIPLDTGTPEVSGIGARIDRAWDAWFRFALDPVEGFDTPEDALAALPGSGAASTALIEVKPAPAPGRLRLGVPGFRFVSSRRARRER